MASSKAPGLKQEQLQKAVKALLKHIGKQQEESKNLLQDEEYLYLVSCGTQRANLGVFATILYRRSTVVGFLVQNITLKKVPQPPKNPSPIRL